MTTALRDTIEAVIEGEISGQVAVGSNNLQIGSIHGGVVNVAVPAQQPVLRPRTPSELVLPRPRAPLFGRETEVDRLLATLEAEHPAEVHGPPGVGKTLLLKHVGHQSAADAPGVYRRVRRQSLDDVLQSLFEAFYEWDGEVAVKPAGGQLRQHLGRVRALVVLDDVDLGRDDVDELLDIASRCTFLLAAERCCLFGTGRAHALGSLPDEAALSLFLEQLGRALDPEELDDARRLCRELGQRPLEIVQAAAVLRDDERPLARVVAEIVAELAPRPPGEGREPALARAVIASLSEREREVLGAVAALQGATLHRDHAAAVTGLADTAAILGSLARRGLVQAHSPRYSLTAPLPEDVAEGLDLDGWTHREARYFADLADDLRREPAALKDDRESILAILESAAERRRWPDVLRLATASDAALAVGGAWGAWQRVLNRALEAARTLGDRAAEAWSLHQLGVRALCLGDDEEARARLHEAVRLREAMGDVQGATVSQFHLGGLGPPPPPPPTPSPSAPPVPTTPPVAVAGAAPLAASAATPLMVVAAVLVLAVALVPVTLVARSGTPSGSREEPAHAGVDTSAGSISGEAAADEKLAAAYPSRVDFGDAAVGASSAPRIVTIANSGATPMRIEGARITGPSATEFSIVGNQCAGAVLDPNGRCTLGVTFHPRTAGYHTAGVTLSGSPDFLTVPLAGAGTSAPAVVASAAASPQPPPSTSPVTPTTVRPPAAAPSAAPPVPNGRLVFSSNRDGDYEVYSMNPDGSGVMQLTSNSASDSHATWSPDRRNVAYHSDITENTEIYRVSTDGTAPTRLTNHPADDREPDWSPDGNRIVFRSNRDGNYEIYVMNADGTGVTRLTDDPGDDVYPKWSPDGNRVVFASFRNSNLDVYTMNADGSGLTRLTTDPAHDDDPAYSPDGTKIAFRSNRDGNYGVYLMNADGSGVKRLTSILSVDYWPTWSPDGKLIAFETDRNGNREIYVMNASGELLSGSIVGLPATNLTRNPGHDVEVDW